jgi:hypothetical protein
VTYDEIKTPRSLDLGCVLLIALVLVATALGFILVRELTSSPTPPNPSSTVPLNDAPDQPGPWLRRTERMRLERELEAAEAELAQIRRDARMDTQPETRAQWRAAIREAEERVAELERRLAR